MKGEAGIEDLQNLQCCYSHRPWKAEYGTKAFEHDRKANSPGGTPRAHYTQRKCTLLFEVLSHDRDSWLDSEAHRETHENALTNKYL